MTLDANGVPTTPVVIRIVEATMLDKTKVPYMGEIGDQGILAYALVGWGDNLGADKRVLVYGELVALASAFGSNNAPDGRPASLQRLEAWGGSNTAMIQLDAGTTVIVSIDGADVQAIYLALGKAAMTAAQAAALQALGSGLVDQSQEMTVAARVMAAKKVVGERS